jgi:signal transduction histidine kinase
MAVVNDTRKQTTAIATQGPEGQRLVAHLQRHHEDERSRVSRMLHHDVAGMLAAARMDLSRLIHKVSADGEVAEPLRRVDQLLEQVIRDARHEMQRLHPALIDHFGLPMALRHLIEERCRTGGIQYTMEFAETVEGLDSPVPIAVFRLVETLLGNPGEIREIEATLSSRREHYLLDLTWIPASPGIATRDDGRDLDLLALRTWLESLGVGWAQSMREQAATIELKLPRKTLPATALQNEAPGA